MKTTVKYWLLILCLVTSSSITIEDAFAARGDKNHPRKRSKSPESKRVKFETVSDVGSGWNRLPNEIKTHLLSFVGDSELRTLRMVSREMTTLTDGYYFRKWSAPWQDKTERKPWNWALAPIKSEIGKKLGEDWTDDEVGPLADHWDAGYVHDPNFGKSDHRNELLKAHYINSYLLADKQGESVEIPNHWLASLNKLNKTQFDVVLAEDNFSAATEYPIIRGTFVEKIGDLLFDPDYNEKLNQRLLNFKRITQLTNEHSSETERKQLTKTLKDAEETARFSQPIIYLIYSKDNVERRKKQVPELPLSRLRLLYGIHEGLTELGNSIVDIYVSEPVGNLYNPPAKTDDVMQILKHVRQLGVSFHDPILEQ